MVSLLKRGLLPAILIALSGIALSGAGTRKFFELTGELPGRDGVKVQMMGEADGKPAVLAEDTVKGGRFHLRYPADRIMPVSLFLKDGKDFSSFTVILEPAPITFGLRRTGQSVISGGDYNRRLYAYHHDAAYVAADEAVWKFRQQLDDLKDSAREWNGFQNFLKRDEIRTGYLLKILDDPSDPLAVAIAAGMLELMPDRQHAMAAVEAAALKLGEDNPAVRQVRQIYANQEAQIARRHDAMMGESFVDFTAPTIEGRNVQLAPLVNAHRYTLVEFWASWCVPCRAEIPGLKRLYETYAPRGFQIVSFSMDHDRYSWVKTSEQSAMPWPNVSDLKAHQSPVVISYKVSSIPANRLIDSSGRVVASNLTGEDLARKIGELFGAAAPEN